MGETSEVVIWWIRRDIRVVDNKVLYEALQTGHPVLPLFIFDSNILSDLGSFDRRVEFLRQRIIALDSHLRSMGSAIWMAEGEPTEIFGRLLHSFAVREVYAGADYEPYSIRRDQAVDNILRSHGCSLHLVHDHLIFSPDEIVKDNGQPYTVFTPYARKWKEKLAERPIKTYPSDSLTNRLMKPTGRFPEKEVPQGFQRQSCIFPPDTSDTDLIRNYAEFRDFPAAEGTSRLGVHLRFGTISIRQLAVLALENSAVFLNELIWREFYQMILFFYPEVVTRSFKPAGDYVKWLNREEDFNAWCQGKTGYPIVDAGMHQLLQTGYMHNRVRMITASFLTKHLLIDWRWGEAFFAEHLLDYELASNNGGWQWAAGTGCDAMPWFRIFNPTLQANRFDPDGEYCRQWVPGYQKGKTDHLPIVDHQMARERAIRVFREAWAAGH
jgi:deoxyribodipyrimidine photo-lyase